MTHALISLMETPTLPVAFTSKLQGFQERGRLLASEDFYIVYEHRPLAVIQMMAVTTGSKIPDCPIEYLYTASVFYRKSRNPHGPSSRPIYVFCLEYSEFTCRMKSRGLFGALAGDRREPEEVFFAVFSENKRASPRHMPNNFSDESAKVFLVKEVSKHLGLSVSEFRDVGPLARGPDCPAIA